MLFSDHRGYDMHVRPAGKHARTRTQARRHARTHAHEAVSVGVKDCNPSTWEVQAKGSGVQIRPWVQCKFEGSLEHMSLKKQTSNQLSGQKSTERTGIWLLSSFLDFIVV